MTKFVSTLAAAAALSCAAGGAFAQAQAARPAAAPAQAQQPALTHGAPVNGVCVFNQQAAIGGSTAGQSVATRLKALGDVVTAELRPEATALQTEEARLRAVTNKQDATFQQQATTFSQRYEAYQRKVTQRQQELQATEVDQLTRISTEIRPLLTTVYQQRQCAVLVDATAVLAFNPAMDVTAAVVQQLNTRLPSLTFDRKRIDPQQPAAQPAAVRR